MKTTLNKIREHSPCASGWTKLLATLNKTKSDDEPVSFITILESNGLDDALWCLRSAPEYNRDSRLFAVWCARQVQHLIRDEISLGVLDVAERHADGLATDDDLAAALAAAGDASGDAEDAAWAAEDAAWDARDAAWAAARAAEDAARDAEAAAWAAARDAAWAAARDAEDAAWAAEDAAWAAEDAARDAQREMFVKMCEGSAPWQNK
jgi:hypothetical protein